MKSTISLVTILMLLFSSCTNRVQREQALRDLEMYQNKSKEIEQSIQVANESLDKLKVELEVAIDNVQHSKEPQLLRTHEEREVDIRNATAYELKVENQIKAVKNSINNYNIMLIQTNSNIEKQKEILKN